MKAKLIKPIMVRALAGEVEITDDEFKRLLLLGAVEPVIVKETKKAKKETKVIEEE